jgi:hypothetical protein
MEELIQKAGLSKTDSAKAMKLLKSGKINMGQIAAKLNQSTPSTIADPHERLKAVLKAKKNDRQSKESKDANYEKMREQVEKDKLAKVEAAENKVKQLAARKRNRVKKLKELEVKYGTISDEKYQDAMNRIANPDGMTDEEINHQKNIVELYARQNKFTETVDFAELDEI